MTVSYASPRRRTMADLLHRLGDIAPDRVLLEPPPGHATEKDVVELDVHEGRLCELVEGTLVEKAVGLIESVLGGAILAALRAFVMPRNLGVVSGESGMMRLLAGLIRIPHVAYISWERLPGRCLPTEPVPQLAPDLVVEVLSGSNTAREMERKRQEYFQAGVRLIWIVDPPTRTVAVYTEADSFERLSATDVLSGGDVLPGFVLPLGELFAELDRQGPAIA